MDVIAYALQALSLVPQIIQAASTAEQAITAVQGHLTATEGALKAMQADGRDPTAEEWDALRATRLQLEQQLGSAQQADPAP